MLRVVEFKTDYRTAGKEPVDMVLLAPSGAGFEKVRTWHRVEKLRPPEDVTAAVADSDSHKDMKAKWSVIGPAYDNWKQGEEIPVDGTPLAAWSAVTPEQAGFLKAMSIRTIEEVRDMGDRAIENLRWPNARQLPKLAKEYLEGAGVAEKDAKILEMQEQMAAMQELLEEQMKPKRGRPKKESVEA